MALLCERFLREPSVRVAPGKARPVPSWISTFCTTGTGWEEEGWEEEEDDTQNVRKGARRVSRCCSYLAAWIALGKATPASVLRVFWGVHRASQGLLLGVDLEICGQMAAALFCLMLHG